MGILIIPLCVYGRVVIENVTHVRLGILAMILCAYVRVVVEVLYTCKTGHFGNNHFYFCLCFCRG